MSLPVEQRTTNLTTERQSTNSKMTWALVVFMLFLGGCSKNTTHSSFSDGGITDGQVSDGQVLSDGGPDVIVALSCNQSDVQAAIDSASSGYVVQVPAGNCVWSENVVINHSVKLKGQTTCIPLGTPGTADYSISCDDSTKITADVNFDDYLLKYQPSDPSEDPFVEITGFTFDGDNEIGKGGAFKVVNYNGVYPVTNLRFHHNKIENVMGRYGIHFNGFVYGLVDNIHFHHIGNNTYHTYAFRYDGHCGMWEQNYPDYGSENFLFFEDNYFTEINYILVNSGTGARWVARYNTIDATIRPQKVFDLHEDVANCGGIAAEIYENIVINDAGVVMRFAQMGMNQVIYNNEVGTVNSGGITLGFAGQTTCINHANEDWQGYVQNTYIWNNTRLSTGLPLAVTESDGGDCFEEDRDYWDDATTSYSTPESPQRSNPNGYGNFWYDLASLRPSTCLDDDSYWETDTKRLYRCDGDNNWIFVYTPYTYPHPLTVTLN